MLPLLLLLFTPKGNVDIVSLYLEQQGLLLDHPTLLSDRIRLQNGHYLNPHNPPPGGFGGSGLLPGGQVGHPTQMAAGRWSAPAIPGENVEVQQSQMGGGDELTETEPR